MKKDIWMDKELWSRIGDTAMKLDKALKGITKPQPLNLENIDEEIIEELNKRQPHDLQTEIDIFKEIIKQRLKFACEFYMKYMNSPEELYDDELNLRCEDLFEFIKEIENSTNECCILVEFNEWLFRLVFKDVLGDDEK